ncbi:hypothetical protein KIPB_010066, partial [Kipferlia bialata]|eukprot:g10066.t1
MGEGVLVPEFGGTLRIGAKVRRGRDWMSGNSDGGPRGEGVLVGVYEHNADGVNVKWDHNGSERWYNATSSCMRLEYVHTAAEDKAERERVERVERQRKVDAEWEACRPSAFTALQSEVESLRTEVTSLKAERHQTSPAFTSFSPSALGGVHTLTERARGFDGEAVAVAVKNLKTYLPLVQGIAPQAQKLREFTKKNKRSKLVTKKCSTLSASLAKMHSAYHTSLASLTALHFNPGDVMQRVRSASDLLVSISAVKGISLPQDRARLSLADTRKYFQVEKFNQAVRELMELIGPIIDCQATIEQCMKDLKGLETPDTEALTALDQECGTLLDTLQRLAKDQAAAQVLVQQLERTPHVTEAEADDEECEIECLGF